MIWQSIFHSSRPWPHNRWSTKITMEVPYMYMPSLVSAMHNIALLDHNRLSPAFSGNGRIYDMNPQIKKSKKPQDIRKERGICSILWANKTTKCWPFIFITPTWILWMNYQLDTALSLFWCRCMNRMDYNGNPLYSVYHIPMFPWIIDREMYYHNDNNEKRVHHSQCKLKSMSPFEVADGLDNH